MKRRLLIALAVLGVLVAVATLVVTGAVPVGTVTLRLDQDTYSAGETITLTIRSLRTGAVQFGSPFAIQRFYDGAWVDVPFGLRWADLPERRVAAWTSELIVLGPGQACQHTFSPAEHFFEAPQTGRYRVVKEIQVGAIHHGAAREQQTLYAEFRIER